MYTLVSYSVLLALAVVASALLFLVSVAFMIVEETARWIGEGSHRFVLRLAHTVKQIPAHNPASEPLSSH